MNSEKAKEIIKIAKYCVEENKPHCVDCIKGEEKDVVLTCRSLVKELLILINDLESENERIKQSAKNLVFVNEKVVEENQQFKDRIAELEEGIAKSMLGCEFLPECTNDKLKQFAERLKEHPTMKIYSLHNACERIPIAIDETLKEFDNGR